MNTILKLYNTLTRRIENFNPLKNQAVGFYACGPTVYDFVHIGNLRTYLFEDILKRVLTYDKYRVNHIMNITDVGHLTSNADEGDDKLEKGAAREGLAVQKIVQKYTSAFLDDIKALNIILPDKLTFASEHITEQIAIIKILVEKGYAYDTPEAVYFDVAKFPDYTKLSGQKLDEKIAGARQEVVTQTAKRSPFDFALWFKLVGKFQPHALHWSSPWGEGFPGWHIECSAMSTKYLGQPFDIHAGGVDLIMPHHTNEIAQSEAAFGQPLANYWLHGEHLLIDAGRMGKSEGNFIRLQDVVDRGFYPLAYRYLCLTAHWRAKLNFTWESLEAAQNALDDLYEKISELRGPGIFACADYIVAFEREINDDLNMPRVVSLLRRLLKSDNVDKLKLATVKIFDQVLGLDLLAGAAARKKIPKAIKDLAKRRQTARKQKDFAKADELRAKIEKSGYAVKDTATGPVVRPLSFWKPETPSEVEEEGYPESKT